MSSFVTVTLDTTGPSSPSIVIDEGLYTNVQLINLALSAGGGDVAQMKVWGDVDVAYDADVQDSEVASAWISYATAKQIKVSSPEASKTIYVKFRDDVYNESAQASDSIIYDPSLVTVSVQSGPSPAKVSKQTGKRTFSFAWQADVIFDEYEVMLVSASGDAHSAGVLIGSANGSTNVAGSSGSYPATTNITTTVDGADLEAAGAGDGSKIVKVFVKEHAEDEVWSA